MTIQIYRAALQRLGYASTACVLLVGTPPFASAAPVIWSAPHAITASTEVATGGGTVLAVHAKYFGMEETVNGVIFKPSPGLALPSHIQHTENGVTFDVNANALNDTAPFLGSKQLTGADADACERLVSNAWEVNGGGTVTLSGLTNGHHYLVQFWVADFREYANNRSLTIGSADATANISPQVFYLGGNGSSTSSGRGNFITGTFTALGTTQAFPINVAGADNAAQINAFQLRDMDFVPPPAAAAVRHFG